MNQDLKVYPFSKIVSATNSFTTSLGQGATGEVFQGSLDGIPIAVKRLKLSDAERVDVRQELNRRFHAELKALRKYAHVRIVRILGFAVDDDKKALHPFAIILELLEGGSLGDWLRGPNDEPSKRYHTRRGVAGGDPLSALERIDIALGSASGLAYLHGYRDPADNPGTRVGGAGAVAAGGASGVLPEGEQVLHRDVKSANIGLAIQGGGSLYAKLLDCGLAKALKGGGDNPAMSSSMLAENVSFTGGLIAGTVGYMAPELAQGRYTVRSEVYALGVVLLELLLGKRVGPRTANDIEEEAEDNEDGIELIAARADSVWPKKIAHMWATITLECIALREKKRPASVSIVIERLKEIRRVLDLTVVGIAPQVLVTCLTCLEDCDEKTGAWCSGTVSRHFCCSGCLQGHVVSVVEDAAKMRSTGGRVPCVSSGAGGCTSTWTIADIGDKLEKATHIVFSQALVQALFEAPKQKMELEAARAAAEAAAKEEGIRISEKVRRLRNVIVERDLTLHCPRCGQAFFDFQGCCALHCKDSCGAAFCGLCLADCGENAHPHFYSVHKGVNIYDKGAFETARRSRCRERVIAAVKDVSVDKEVCKLLIEELGKADLDELGMTMDELFQEVYKREGESHLLSGQTTNVVFKDVYDLRSDSTKQVQIIENEKAPDVLPEDDPVELVRLARQDSVRKNAYEIMRVASALRNMSASAAGIQSCVRTGAASALVALSRMRIVKENSEVTEQVVGALRNISESDTGVQSCVDAGAAAALVALARDDAVKENVEAAKQVAGALRNISTSAAGVQSCVYTGAASALVGLDCMRIVKENSEVAELIAGALFNISKCAAGMKTFNNARASAALLVALPHRDAVRENSEAAQQVAGALRNISTSFAGVQSPRAASASVASSPERVADRVAGDLSNISEIDTGAHSPRVAFASLALSHERVADRVAATLRDVFETDAGAHSTGAASALVALARDDAVKENIEAAEQVARALRNISTSAVGVQSCVHTGAASALVALARKRIVKENSDVTEQVVGALRNISESAAGMQSCIDAGAASVLVALSNKGVVNDNDDIAKQVAGALHNISTSAVGVQSCVHTGAASALVAMSRMRIVKENSEVAKQVVGALRNISESDAGVQSCIDAGAAAALVALSHEGVVNDNDDIAKQVAGALHNISTSAVGVQSCVHTGAASALVAMSRMRIVKENSEVAKQVVGALRNISESDAGVQSCIDAGAAAALVALSHEGVVKENGDIAIQIGITLRNISTSFEGLQSCINAGASLSAGKLFAN
jgi:serine/threonine protein kinase